MTQEATQLRTDPPYPGLAMVQDINKALQTLGTNFAGTADPAALAWAYSTWADTGTGTLKRRNDANTAWIIEGRLFVAHMPIIPLADVPTTDIGPIHIVGKGTAEWDGAAYAAVIKTERRNAIASGTTDARTATLDPAITAYVDQELYLIRIPAANATATPTLDLGGGAKTVVKGDAVPLIAGDMAGDCVFQWNATLDEFVLINPTTSAALNALDEQLGFAIIYPNGGSEGSPANVSVNSRYVESNPFPGHHVYTVVQLKMSGKWEGVGFTDISTTDSVGVYAGQRDFEGADELVLITGKAYFALSSPNITPSTAPTTTQASTPLPCRVLVWKLKGVTA